MVDFCLKDWTHWYAIGVAVSNKGTTKRRLEAGKKVNMMKNWKRRRITRRRILEEEKDEKGVEEKNMKQKEKNENEEGEKKTTYPVMLTLPSSFLSFVLFIESVDVSCSCISTLKVLIELESHNVFLKKDCVFQTYVICQKLETQI